MSEVAERVKVLIDGFDARVQAAAADAWNNASPCEGWTAKDVVRHVADNLLSLGGAMQGAQLDATSDDETTAELWARARDAFLGVVDGADLSVSVPGPMGPMPLEQMIGRFVSTDILVHTWDVARSVGGDEALPAETVAAAYSGLKPMDAMIRRPGVFGPKVDAPADADLQTEFLTFLGRAV